METPMNAPIREMLELRNRREVFRDRVHAGHVLGGMLEREYGRVPDAVLLAIPSGGVPVGLEIGRMLALPFDMIIVRKIPIPGNTEAGFGAITIDGNISYDEEFLRQLHFQPGEMELLIGKVRRELEERNLAFRGGRPFPDLSGKVAILVDDGLAAGHTMTASIGMARRHGARKAVVAVPTAPASSVETMRSEADEIFCPNIREGGYFAVADAYDEWRDLTREEVSGLLESRGLIMEKNG